MKKPPTPVRGTPDFPENLFWDVDFKDIDWEKNKRWVIERVLLRGGWEEFKELNRFYSEEEIKANIIKIRYLDSKTLNFASNFYGIPKEQFQCFILKQSGLQLWG
jgi:hypothetical protein